MARQAICATVRSANPGHTYTPKTQFSLCQNGPELLYCAVKPVIYVRGLRMYSIVHGVQTPNFNADA